MLKAHRESNKAKRAREKLLRLPTLWSSVWWVPCFDTIGKSENLKHIGTNQSRCGWSRCAKKRKKPSNKADHKLCGQCRFVFYCSKKCQKNDWNIGSHKKYCKRLQKCWNN